MTATDPLAALLRVRRLARDEARRGLAEALGAEHAAAERLGATVTEIATETARAERMEAPDAAVEIFGAWLRLARSRRTLEQEARDRAAAESARARAALAAAHAVYEAVEILLTERAQSLRGMRERAEQLALEDAARAPANRPGGA